MMNTNDWVVYSIEASGCHSQNAVKVVTDLLAKYGVPGQYQRIGPFVPEKDDRPAAPGYVTVPRLVTQWRGNDEEKAWQKEIKKTLAGYAEIVTIRAEPWQMLPGYPQGEL